MARVRILIALFLAVLARPAWGPGPETVLFNPRFQVTPELARLSARLEKLQKALKEKFGIERIYIGGGSSHAVLDHVYRGQPIDMRDLDIFAVADRKVDRKLSLEVARYLASQGLGTLDLKDLNEKHRANPALPEPGRRNHSVGYGFFLQEGPSYLDIGLFHSRADLALNGILNTDTTLIPLDHDVSLSQFVTKQMCQKPYDQLLKEGLVEDPHAGYRNRLTRTPKVIHWENVERDFVANSVRVIRGLLKAGDGSIAPDVIDRIRRGVQARPTTERAQLARNIFKALADPTAAEALKVLIETGILGQWSEPLDKAVRRLSPEERRRLFSDRGRSRLTALFDLIDGPSRRALLAEVTPRNPTRSFSNVPCRVAFGLLLPLSFSGHELED